MQEYDYKVMSKIHPVPKLATGVRDDFPKFGPLEKQLRKIFLSQFKAGEANIFDAYDILFVEDTPKLERYRSAMEKHQKAFSRIIYEQYLQKVIKDITNQIFQERPSLP